MKRAGYGRPEHLGRAIARWIVDSHGMTIELANRTERGAMATVRLPVIEDDIRDERG